MPDPVLRFRPPALSATLAPLETEPRRAFDRLGELGYRSVQFSAMQAGLRPRELDQSARRDLLASLRRRELAVSGLDAWIPPEHLLDPARADRATAALLDTIRLAGDLDRCCVSLTLPEAATDDEARRLEPVIAALVETAEHMGVPLADHAVPVTRRAGIGLGLDPVAWLAASEDPAEAVLRHAEHTVAARLADLNAAGMRSPATGGPGCRLDLRAYQVALSTLGLTHPVVVDARQWTDPWTGLSRTIQAWDGVAAI